MQLKAKTVGMVVAIALPIIILSLHPPTVAQTPTKDQSSFRISRLETEVRGLRSQIRQLEGQLSRVQRIAQNNGDLAPLPIPNESTSSPELTEPGAALMFDQLATLVIETRQDMFALQERIANLEQGISANPAPQN